MERRDLLRALASAAALSVIPHRKAFAAWTRVESLLGVSNGLNDTRLALVRAMADSIIPRTDSPSATDVGVDKFVDVIYAEYATEEDRTKFVAGLAAIDERAKTTANGNFAELSPADRGKVIDSMESGARDADPAQTHWRLKGLIVHGYFTSEPVMKNVLKTQIMFTDFKGAAPVAIKKRPVQAGGPTPAPKQEEHHHG